MYLLKLSAQQVGQLLELLNLREEQLKDDGRESEAEEIEQLSQEIMEQQRAKGAEVAKDIGVLVSDTYEDPLSQLPEGSLDGKTPLYMLQLAEGEDVFYSNQAITAEDVAHVTSSEEEEGAEDSE
jgi:hypothetical protein